MNFLNRKKPSFFRKTVSLFVLTTFGLSMIASPSGAQILPNLPAPGQSIWLTPVFQPPVLRGMTVHPENPLLFDFIVDRGQDTINNDRLKEESTKLIKYFLASMTIPDKDAWVNLSPYEKDRIIPDALGQTEMGRQMLEQDYILKQLASSLTNPDKELGQKFWNEVKARAKKQFGTTEIPLSTFNKVWIIPDGATVVEKDGFAYITESKLNVMLDEDYNLSSQVSSTGSAPVLQVSSTGSVPALQGTDPREIGIDPSSSDFSRDVSNLSTAVFREMILPKLVEEVNTGKNFAQTRQVYQSVILAAWYKKALKDSLLGRIYADKSKVAGVESDVKDIKQKVYEQYLEAFKKGAYNLIKEEDNGTEDPLPRKYFSGGEVMHMASRSLQIVANPIAALNAARDASENPRLTGIQALTVEGQNESAAVYASHAFQANQSSAASTLTISVASVLELMDKIDADYDNFNRVDTTLMRRIMMKAVQFKNAGPDKDPNLVGGLKSLAAMNNFDGSIAQVSHVDITRVVALIENPANNFNEDMKAAAQTLKDLASPPVIKPSAAPASDTKTPVILNYRGTRKLTLVGNNREVDLKANEMTIGVNSGIIKQEGNTFTVSDPNAGAQIDALLDILENPNQAPDGEPQPVVIHKDGVEKRVSPDAAFADILAGFQVGPAKFAGRKIKGKDLSDLLKTAIASDGVVTSQMHLNSVIHQLLFQTTRTYPVSGNTDEYNVKLALLFKKLNGENPSLKWSDLTNKYRLSLKNLNVDFDKAEFDLSEIDNIDETKFLSYNTFFSEENYRRARSQLLGLTEKFNQDAAAAQAPKAVTVEVKPASVTPYYSVDDPTTPEGKLHSRWLKLSGVAGHLEYVDILERFYNDKEKNIRSLLKALIHFTQFNNGTVSNEQELNRLLSAAGSFKSQITLYVRVNNDKYHAEEKMTLLNLETQIDHLVKLLKVPQNFETAKRSISLKSINIAVASSGLDNRSSSPIQLAEGNDPIMNLVLVALNSDSEFKKGPVVTIKKIHHTLERIVEDQVDISSEEIKAKLIELGATLATSDTGDTSEWMFLPKADKAFRERFALEAVKGLALVTQDDPNAFMTEIFSNVPTLSNEIKGSLLSGGHELLATAAKNPERLLTNDDVMTHAKLLALARDSKNRELQTFFSTALMMGAWILLRNDENDSSSNASSSLLDIPSDAPVVALPAEVPAAVPENRPSQLLTRRKAIGRLLGLAAVNIGGVLLPEDNLRAQNSEASQQAKNLASNYFKDILDGKFDRNLYTSAPAWRAVFTINSDDPDAVKSAKRKYQTLVSDAGSLNDFFKALVLGMRTAIKESEDPHWNSPVNVELAAMEFMNPEQRMEIFLKYSLPRYVSMGVGARRSPDFVRQHGALKKELLQTAKKVGKDPNFLIEALVDSANNVIESKGQSEEKNKQFSDARDAINKYLLARGYFLHVSLSVNFGDRINHLYIKSYHVDGYRSVQFDGVNVKVALLKGNDNVIPTTTQSLVEANQDFPVVFIDALDKTIDQLSEWSSVRGIPAPIRNEVVALNEKQFQGLTRKQILERLINITVSYTMRAYMDAKAKLSLNNSIMKARAFAQELVTGGSPYYSLGSWAVFFGEGSYNDTAARTVFQHLVNEANRTLPPEQVPSELRSLQGNFLMQPDAQVMSLTMWGLSKLDPATLSKLAESYLRSTKKTASNGSLDSNVAFVPAAVSAPAVNPDQYGGIDFDPSKLNLQIKRDGRGVPLPLPQQNLENINIKGLYPIIINVFPLNAQTVPILGQLNVQPAAVLSRR